MIYTFDVVFCVLTYKNEKDLIDFLNSIRDKCLFRFKCVVVNSFFDDVTRDKIKEVADRDGCDFINVPNKGYGAGNNRAIEFAFEKYQFDYLIVCNPDTVVRSFNLNCLEAYEDKCCIFAPKIICASGKEQNPAMVNENKTADKLIYKGYTRDRKLPLIIGIGLNKIKRRAFNSRKNSGKRIFQAHGSFVIFSRSALEKLMPVYDENIFLFCEEMDLAFKAKANNVETIYIPEIDIYHKEDGSMKLTNLNLYNEIKKSCIYCSEKWGINK